MEEESWIKQYWRPIMAYQYAFVCLFDFVIGPILTFIYYKYAGGVYIQWDPLTLKESGFYHLSMATIVGVSAWSRGQEKIVKLGVDGKVTQETTATNTIQTPSK
jgi:hypothetical protein